MRLTEEGKKLIHYFEGLSSKDREKNVYCTQEDIENNITIYPYYCPANVLTIGYGHVIKDHEAHLKEGITCKEAMELFERDMVSYVNTVRACLAEDKVELTPNQFSALVSFHYNTGGYPRSTLRKVIKADKNNLAEIEKQLLRWNKINGDTVARGLTTRRQKEFDFYKKYSMDSKKEDSNKFSNTSMSFLSKIGDYIPIISKAIKDPKGAIKDVLQKHFGTADKEEIEVQAKKMSVEQLQDINDQMDVELKKMGIDLEKTKIEYAYKTKDRELESQDFKNSIDDTHDAREYFKDDKRLFHPIYIVIGIIGVYGIMAFFMPLEGANRDFLYMILNILSTIVAGAVSYHYGVSVGTKKIK